MILINLRRLFGFYLLPLKSDKPVLAGVDVSSDSFSVFLADLE